MNFLNVNDADVVKYVKEYVITYKLCENSVKLQNIISLFPFAKLLDCDSINEELIKNLTDILSVFTISPTFYNKSNIEFTIDFILIQVNFLTKSSRSERTLFNLMKLLCEICFKLKKLRSIKQFLNVERICEILIELFSSRRHNEIKSYGKKILITFLSSGEYLEVNQHIKNCIEEVYKKSDPLQNRTELFQLLNITLKKYKKIDGLDESLKWLEFGYSSLLYDSQTNLDTLKLLIDCIWLCFERDDELMVLNKKLLMEMRQNLHKVCLTLIKIQSSEFDDKSILIKKMEDLLFVILKEECKKLQISWHNGFDNLRNEISKLIKTDDWSKSLSDVFFFIAYIQCLNNRMQWDSVTVLEAIRRKVITTEFVPLLTLRSIAFLYSILAENSIKFDRAKLFILKELMVYKQLITPHPLQIQWILREAPLKLKFHALRVCFENNPDDYQDIFDNSLDNKSLVNYVISTNDNLSYKQWIIQILRGKKSYTLTNYILRSIITNDFIEPESMALLFQIEPLTPRNGNMCFVILQHLKNVIYCVDNTTSLRCIFIFVTNILNIYHADPRYYLSFCEASRTIRFLIYRSINDEESGGCALKLLKLLARLQCKHKISVMESFTIHFVPLLCGGDDKLIDGLELLLIVLRRRARVPILKLNESNIIELFHKLQDLSFTLSEQNIFRCLTYLLFNWEYLINSTVTAVLIDEYFVNGQNNCFAGFLSFLNVWLKKIYRYRITLCGITAEELLIYLNEVNVQYPVKEMMNLLNKIANREELF